MLGDIELPSLLFPLLLVYPFVRHKKVCNILAVIVLLRIGDLGNRLATSSVSSSQISWLEPAHSQHFSRDRR